MAKERISDFNDRFIEIAQSEKTEGGEKQIKKNEPASEKCGTSVSTTRHAS